MKHMQNYKSYNTNFCNTCYCNNVLKDANENLTAEVLKDISKKILRKTVWKGKTGLIIKRISTIIIEQDSWLFWHRMAHPEIPAALVTIWIIVLELLLRNSVSKG